MGTIGVAYRVVYQAVAFRTGLTDVVAYVLKPDGNIAGPFAMVESPSFSGIYQFNYVTTGLDPEGEYIITQVSPTEGIRTTSRASLYRTQPSPSVLAGQSDFQGFVSSPLIQGKVQDEDEADVVVGDRGIEVSIHSSLP